MKNKLLILSCLSLLVSCNNSFYNSSNSNSDNNLSSLENEMSETTSNDENSLSINDTDSSFTSNDKNSYQVINSVNDLDQDAFYNEFFDYTSDIEITLTFKNDAIYNLAKYSSDSIKKEMYHPCDMDIKMNDITYHFPEVGARMKGNTSKNENFVDNSGKLNSQIHFKISVNQTFDNVEDNDYYIKTYENNDDLNIRKKRRIGSAKKFDLKYNKNDDYCFTKQIYAYHCFEDAGLPVQKNNLVKLNVVTESDSYSYYYELQECVDEEFLQRRYDLESSSGSLYKSCYTSMGPADMSLDSLNRIGIESGSYTPSYDLKTNKKTETHDLLKNFITTLNNDKSDAETFKTTLNEILDVDQFIKYAALSWVIGNPDDLRNNYNNYYLYFESKTNKAIIIPYDYDRCFGILKDWPIDLSNTPWYTTKQNLGNRPWQKNPLYWRTILVAPTGENVEYATNYPNINEYREQYYSLCLEYASLYLDVSKYEEFNNQFVYSNKDINNAGNQNMTFAQYATNKLNTFNS